MPEEAAVRIDKWLWCVRLFKTRNQATEACRAGKVKFRDQSVKPSREIRPGEVFIVNTGTFIRTVEVLALLHNRVGAKFVGGYYADHTPAEELERQEMLKVLRAEGRERGSGRPTKRERRQIDRMKGPHHE